MLPLLGLSCEQLTQTQPAPRPEQPQTDSMGWHTLKSGAQRRIMHFERDTNTYEMLVYRLNPKSIQWDLSYSKEGKRLEDAHQQQHALLSINGSYFTEEFLPTGLFIDDGDMIASAAYEPEESGTLVIENGRARLVDTAVDPQKLAKDADVLQSFPHLVSDGKATISEDSGKIARRTAIGLDKQGRWLIIIVDQTALSLFTFAQLLAASDLELTEALNLDGGPSTGLVYSDAEFSEAYLPLLPLPIVLSVLPVSQAVPNGR